MRYTLPDSGEESCETNDRETAIEMRNDTMRANKSNNNIKHAILPSHHRRDHDLHLGIPAAPPTDFRFRTGEFEVEDETG